MSSTRAAAFAVALLTLMATAPRAASAGGLSDHAVAGSGPNFPLSGDGSPAMWTLSAAASDGKGCDTVADTDLNTTQILATVKAPDAAACCAACRAQAGCLASVLTASTHSCTLHNLTGLQNRVRRPGSQACFMGPEANPAVAIPASVPGDHLTALQQAGLIEDPLFDQNFLNASVWGARTWTYTATFPAPASLGGAGDAMLVFDGVKMGARVSLNDQPLGTVVDQFLRYEFNVTGKFVTGNNTLTLVFDQDIDVNGRFMACSGGWDWAPYSTTYNRWGTKVFTLGIWKDVYVVRVAPQSAAIMHVVPAVRYTGDYPTAPLTDSSAAPFEVNVTVHTWAPRETRATLSVEGGWDAGHPVSTTVDVPAGAGAVTAKISAHGVKLWWPNGFGEQPLYNLSVSLSFAASASPPRTVDRVTAVRRIGFRYAVLVTGNDTDPAYVQAAASQDGSSQRGEMNTFIFRVNGAPVYAKGANMVPMEELEGRSHAAALRYLVFNAAQAGYTILRNWGGGIFQYDAWYDALDEFGILCYQDLMYAQGQHSPTYADPTQAAEIAHQVRRLSHHPSMALYTSCNECIFHGNMTLYVNFAMEVVAAETKTTPLWPSCPAAGWKSGVNRLTGYASGTPLATGGHTLDLHGPYIQGCTTAFTPANGCFGTNKQEPFGPVTTTMLVNQTIWPPWGRSGPIGVGLQGTVFSEYGATVFSSFESMSATLSPENWGIQRPVWAQRNYPCDNFILAFFGASHSNVSAVGEFALQRQTWQCMIAQALYQKQYTEALRSMNTVLTQMWQYNEIWPTGGWGAIEYGTPVKGQVIGGRWKPLQHFLRRSVYATVGAACLDDGRCYVRNDGKTAFSGSLRLTLVDLATGTASWTSVLPLSIARGAHTVQWLCVQDAGAPGGNCTSWESLLASAKCTAATCVFNADVLGPDASGAGDGTGALLSSNQQLLMPPGDLQVPTDARVEAIVGEPAADGRIPVTVNASKTALLVTLTTLAPGVFSDNVFLLTQHAQARLLFTPYGQVTAADVRASLRIAHLAQYL